MARKPNTQRYTDEQKAEAVVLYIEAGPTEVERQTGIPKGTVTRWAKKRNVETVSLVKKENAVRAMNTANARSREDLKERLLQRAHDLMDRMDLPHKEFKGQNAREVWYDSAPSDAVRAYATSLGIVIDKLRLESGEATERREVLTGEVDSIDAEIRKLVDNFAGDVGETTSPVEA